MADFPCLKIFIDLSLLLLILGDTLVNSKAAAVDIDHVATDGEQFVKKIVHGHMMSEKPGYLMFTAPYRLCEGGCKSDNNNFVMAFPLFVGAKGKAAYKSLYNRDHGKIHSGKPNAPFREKTTREPVTPCPTEKINKNIPILPHLIYKDTSESLEENSPQVIVLDDSIEKTIETSAIVATTKVLNITEKSPQSSASPSSIKTTNVKKCPKMFPRLCMKKKPKYLYSDIADEAELYESLKNQTKYLEYSSNYN